MITIAPDCKIQRKATYLETELDDETIIMQLKTGRISSMAGTSKEIWARLSEPTRFGDLIDYLVGEFEVDRDTCIADVRQFLSELERQDLISIGVA